MSHIAKTYKKELSRGESLRLRFNRLDANGDQLDVENYTGEAHFHSVGETTPLVFPINFFALPVDYNFELVMSPAQTATLNVGVNEVRLKLVDPANNIYMLPDEGHIKIVVKTNDAVNV